MPSNLTDTSAWTDPVQTVADGDNANAAAFALSPQGLANRTRWLRNKLIALFGTLGTARIDVVPPSLGKAMDDALWTRDNDTGEGSVWHCDTNSGEIAFPIDHMLREGTIINTVSLRVNPGGSSATGSNTMCVGVRILAFDLTTGALAATSNMNTVVPAQAADSSAAAQTLTYTPGVTPVTFLTAFYRLSYEIVVKAASTAASTADHCASPVLNLTHPSIDA